MLIRAHRNRDIPAIARLYYDTIHLVNSHDYALEQIEAWAPTIPDAAFWKVYLGCPLSNMFHYIYSTFQVRNGDATNLPQ